MPLDESFDHIWAFISFVISRGLHHGLLPKRDKVAESTHTNGLVFWGRCSPDCRPPASRIAGSHGHLGWTIKGLSWLPPIFFLGLPLTVKTREEDLFGILRCLSCDQVGKRFTHAGTQNNRLLKIIIINWIPTSVNMGAFGNWQRHRALLLGRRFLECQPLFLQTKDAYIPPKGRGTTPENRLAEITSSEIVGERTLQTLLKLMLSFLPRSNPFQTFSTKF